MACISTGCAARVRPPTSPRASFEPTTPGGPAIDGTRFQECGDAPDFTDADQLTYDVRLFGVTEPVHFEVDVSFIGKIGAQQFTYTVATSSEKREFSSSSVLLLASIRWQSHERPGGKFVVTGPADFLKNGLAEACRWVIEQGAAAEVAAAPPSGPGTEKSPAAAAAGSSAGDGNPADIQVLSRLYISLIALFHTLKGVPEFEAVVMQALEKPSIWSMISHAGISISIRNQFEDIQAIDPELFRPIVGDQQVYLLPLILEANDLEALRCKLWVTSPRRPLTLCAGVLAIDGVHPKDPRRKIEVRLIGTRSRK